MERFFKLKERGTNVRTEFIAGMTTFFSMVYILMVNADMFANPLPDGSNPLGVSYGAIYIATAISAVVGTVLAGLLANLPLAHQTHNKNEKNNFKNSIEYLKLNKMNERLDETLDYISKNNLSFTDGLIKMTQIEILNSLSKY